MSTSVERRFNAAVNVIRGLPKNGSYQPSNDMMLRFYSYFKQATLGPCTQKKPPFWDLVSKAKYDAYKSLGNLPKDRAMELYVEELKKIIETMSYTNNVAEFMGSISELDGIDFDDLEVIAPEAIKKARSHPNSPFASRESSPNRAPQVNGHVVNGNGHVNAPLTNGNGPINGFSNGHTSEHSDDEYIDTVEDDNAPFDAPTQLDRPSRASTRRTLNNPVPTDKSSDTVIAPSLNQLIRTIEAMRTDLQQINTRINTVERSLSEVKNHQLRKKIMEMKYPNWWPFTEISPNWFILLIVWPFLTQRIIRMIRREK